MDQDYVSDRTVTMNSGAVTIGPIGKAAHITQPVTAEVYQSVNQLFNTQGTFTYDSGFGAPGRVLVYGLPTITSVTPDKDSTNGNTPLSFTLTGTNFGTSQTSVNGSVKFIQVNESDPNNPWGTIYTVSAITSWGNTSIAGTVSLPEGKYRIEVTVRGENTTETVYFYKGTGTYEVIVGDPVGMVLIPNGTFNMGSTVNPYESPIHSVTVSSFYTGKYEVTNSDYVVFLNSQGNQTEGGVEWIDLTANQWNGITGGPNPGTFTVVPGYENRPVVYITWCGAVAYCNWLSSQHGYTPCYGPINNRGNDPSVWRTLKGYRLPTEAEWEYACRGGSTAEYYWGDPYPPDPPNIGNYSWYTTNSDGNHHNIGGKSPNSFGLYDMSGNILEWCSDWNDNNYYSISPGTNPTGPSTGLNRVHRGGSWNHALDRCRSGNRGYATPYGRYNVLGFRLFRTK